MNFISIPSRSFPPTLAFRGTGATRRTIFHGLRIISFGKTGSFSKFPLFLSKKRGGVNTAARQAGRIYPRSRALTATAGAVYDQGKPWRRVDQRGRISKRYQGPQGAT